MGKSQMITKLRVIIHTTDMHVMTSQRTINRPISTEGQARAVYERFFTNTMAKADTVAFLAKDCRVRDKLSFCGWQNKPAPKLLDRSNMAKGAITVIFMRVCGLQPLVQRIRTCIVTG